MTGRASTAGRACTDCLEPESKQAGNHEGDGGAGGEGGPAQAQAAEHGKTLPAPRCGRTATHAMGGMKGVPGPARRDPPKDEEAARKCPDCGDELDVGDSGRCEGCMIFGHNPGGGYWWMKGAPGPASGAEFPGGGYCGDCPETAHAGAALTA